MKESLYNFFVQKSKGRIVRENLLKENSKSIKYNEGSPKRIEIMLQKQITENQKNKDRFMTGIMKSLPQFIGAFKGVNKSLVTLNENSFLAKKRVDDDFISKLEHYAYSLGVSAIGYTTIAPEYIFKDKAVLYKNVIVITKEMDKKIINMGPNSKSQKLVWGSYNNLSNTANKLAAYLRKYGYGAHAGPPMAGLSVYPALGEKAGLGAVGKNGLLISPNSGASQRIAVIYTSIGNLPQISNNEHLWLKRFCEYCNKCIRSCPEEAILQEPIKHNSNSLTYINTEKCLNSFINNYGCSICIKDCPFTSVGYENIKAKFKK